jgi:hypothetical protein
VAAQTAVPACPGSRTVTWEGGDGDRSVGASQAEGSSLRQWPIQLHLLPPSAGFLEDAHVLLAADCVAFSVGGFHRRFLSGRALAIACPKLDSHQEIYVDKLVAMIDGAKVSALTVMVMEVPCCSGLVRLTREAMARAQRTVPATALVVGVRGEVLGQHTL